MLDQRPIGVQGALQIGHRHAVDARPGGQVDRRRIGPVQADHAPGRLHDVARAMAGRQAVAAGQPGSALRDLDLSHGGILPWPYCPSRWVATCFETETFAWLRGRSACRRWATGSPSWRSGSQVKEERTPDLRWPGSGSASSGPSVAVAGHAGPLVDRDRGDAGAGRTRGSRHRSRGVTGLHRPRRRHSSSPRPRSWPRVRCFRTRRVRLGAAARGRGSDPGGGTVGDLETEATSGSASDLVVLGGRALRRRWPSPTRRCSVDAATFAAGAAALALRVRLAVRPRVTAPAGRNGRRMESLFGSGDRTLSLAMMGSAFSALLVHVRAVWVGEQSSSIQDVLGSRRTWLTG